MIQAVGSRVWCRIGEQNRMVPHFFAIPLDEVVMRMNDVQTAIVVEEGLVAEASIAAESGFDTKRPFTGGYREMRSFRKHNCGSSPSLMQFEVKSRCSG